MTSKTKEEMPKDAECDIKTDAQESSYIPLVEDYKNL